MANRVCEKCIYYDACLLHEDNFIDDVAKNGFCGKFKNRADFVEVVRCKDCKYQDDCARQMVHTRRDYVLEQNISSYNKVDFCSYGERRDK